MNNELLNHHLTENCSGTHAVGAQPHTWMHSCYSTGDCSNTVHAIIKVHSAWQYTLDHVFMKFLILFWLENLSLSNERVLFFTMSTDILTCQLAVPWILSPHVPHSSQPVIASLATVDSTFNNWNNWKPTSVHVVPSYECDLHMFFVVFFFFW